MKLKIKKKKSSNIDLTQATVMQDVSTIPIEIPKSVNDPFPQAIYCNGEDDLDVKDVFSLIMKLF